MSDEKIYCKSCGVPLCSKEEKNSIVKTIKCNCCGLLCTIEEEKYTVIKLVGGLDERRG